MRVHISVIIPVYNAAEFLQRTLDCIIGQTLKEVEIICVNDGSTDNSLEILKNFSAKDNRIKIITQENKNAGAARNIGLEAAQGEYLSFLDADDLFELDMLECAYKKAIAHSAEVVIYDADIFDSDSGAKLLSDWIVNRAVIPQKAVFEACEILEKIFTAFFHVPWNRLISRSYIKNLDLKFQEIEKHNDSYFAAMSLIYAKHIHFIDSVFVHYRKGTDRQISGNALGKKDFYPALIAMQAIHDKIKNMNGYDVMLRDFINYSTDLLLLPFKMVNKNDYYRVFKLLNEEWLTRFPGELFKSKEYFYKFNAYRQIKSIYDNDVTEHLLTLVDIKNEVIRNLSKRYKNIRSDTE